MTSLIKYILIYIVLGAMAQNQKDDSENSFRVSANDQYRITKQKRYLCYKQILEKNYSSLTPVTTESGKCPEQWDTLMCWPESEPGTLVKQRCPYYVDTFRINGTATRECTNQGTWLVKDNNTWTNYSDCVKTNKENIASLSHIRNIAIIGQMGYSISIVTLIVAILILCGFRKLRCDRNYIHLNLFIAFLFRSLFSFAGIFENKNTFICRPLRTMTNYFIQASYQSISTEALYMHNMIFYHVFDASKANILIYILTSWIIPGVVILIWALLRYKYDDAFCWDLSVDVHRRHFWFLQGYLILLMLVNCILFIRLTFSICSKVNSNISREQEKYKKLARSICILVIVFGVYNVIIIPVELAYTAKDMNNLSNGEIIKLYCEHFMNSFQGALVSLLLCFVNGEVHREIKSFINKKHQQAHFQPPSTSNQNIKYSNNQNNTNTEHNNEFTKEQSQKVSRKNNSGLGRRSHLYENIPNPEKQVPILKSVDSNN